MGERVSSLLFFSKIGPILDLLVAEKLQNPAKLRFTCYLLLVSS